MRCFVFDIPKEVCIHNNIQRQTNTARKHLSGKVPTIPIHSFFKNAEKPSMNEGYTEIKTIKFTPKFESPEDEKAYKSLS